MWRMGAERHSDILVTDFSIERYEGGGFALNRGENGEYLNLPENSLSAQLST